MSPYEPAAGVPRMARRVRNGCGIAATLGVCAALVACASDEPGALGLKTAAIYIAALLIWSAVAGDEIATLLGYDGRLAVGALSGCIHTIGCFALLAVVLLNYFTGSWVAAVPALGLFLLASALAALAYVRAGAEGLCAHQLTNEAAGMADPISDGQQFHD